MTVRGFLGGILWCIGVLMAFLSGGCSLLYLGWILTNMVSYRDNVNFSDLKMALSICMIVGGIPFVIGMVLLFIGKGIKQH
jgi:hypothetical protein